MSFIQKNPKAFLAVALVVLLLAVINLFRPDKPPKVVEDVYLTIYKNWVLQAEQLAGALDHGSKVVVMDFDRETGGARGREYKQVLGAFEDGGLSIEHVERLVVNEEAGWDQAKSGFPYFEFERLAEEYPNVDAVVSLVGPPYALPRNQKPDPSAPPKLLVVTTDNDASSAARLFERGWVYATTVQIKDEQGKTYELLAE